MFRRRLKTDVSILPSSRLYQDSINRTESAENPRTQETKDRLVRTVKQNLVWILSVTTALILLLLLLRYTALANIVSEAVEASVKDPYRRAKVFNPFRTFHALYLDRQRPQGLKTFHLTNKTAFVVNLDRDKDRLAEFMSRNPSFIQRFPAHQWVTTPSENTGKQQIQVQQDWGVAYPWIRIAANRGKPGDAACSLSHLLLWKEQLLGPNATQDYIFVFEDDIKMMEPLRSKLFMQAPDVADIVFLMASAMKRARVPWKKPNQDNSWNVSKRVIGGFGTFGYLITKRGASKMMDHLATCREPIDLAFFGSSSILKIGHWCDTHQIQMRHHQGFK